MELERGLNGRWIHRWTFVLAAAGSAVGLGNIWKFPYVAGENGGGVFVLVYLVCIALVGVPIMLAEAMLGRRGRMSPINTMTYLARESNVSSGWALIGWSGIVAGMLILSFYSVVAGWALHYLLLSLNSAFSQIDAPTAGELFGALLANPGQLIVWHTLFLFITLGIVCAGVVKGLGVAVRTMMPMLLVLLLALFLYSATVGNLTQATHFLFDFNPQDFTWGSVLIALGHAFFTLSLGMGAIMAYGAYLPENTPSLGKMVAAIAVLDTAVAILAGLVIFPIVFANPSIEPGAGPGLLFISLPLAFGSMPLGSFFAAVFFFLILIAALSSSISMIEPTVAWLVERKAWSRIKITAFLGAVIWLLGLGTVFSFNIWQELTLWGRNFFDTLDFITANLMLPLGGLCIAVFVGWIMNKAFIEEEIGDIRHGIYHGWMIVLRYVSPLLLLVVFVMTLVDKLGS
ncbi:MAG: sodium-dependent transporter [Pseudomonadota bacterium]